MKGTYYAIMTFGNANKKYRIVLVDNPHFAVIPLRQFELFDNLDKAKQAATENGLTIEKIGELYEII